MLCLGLYCERLCGDAKAASRSSRASAVTPPCPRPHLFVSRVATPNSPPSSEVLLPCSMMRMLPQCTPCGVGRQ